jgi:DNA-binding Lrp family transcriptional regulator
MTDLLDQKIIDLLKQNGRYTCAAIAQELKVNVATVAKRIDHMLAEDVIAIKTVLNPFKLGFNHHAFVTLDIDLTKVDSICDRLVDSPNISLVATAFGRYDLLLLADFSTWETLQEYVAKGLSRTEGISKINAFPIVEIKKLYNGLFTYTSLPGGSLPGAPPVLDDIDRSIISELGKNGRLPFTDLASRLNLSLTTISRRVARLRREDILGIAAVRNPSKWGYLSNAYISIHADLNKVQAICNSLATCPEIHLIMTAMSEFEILAGIHSPSSEQMYRFIVDKVARIDGVSNIETFICAEIRKRAYALFDSARDELVLRRT